jgi:hypothetical protein
MTVDNADTSTTDPISGVTNKLGGTPSSGVVGDDDGEKKSAILGAPSMNRPTLFDFAWPTRVPS